MSGHEGKGGLLWWGPPAGTNGPGRLDDRRYPQNATFMTHLSPASCQFTLGSAVLRKNTKKTQPVYFEDMPNTGGTLLHKRPLIDAGMLETDRRAEYDRRAAYDIRVELTRRAEYDRRLEYDRRNKIAMCPIRNDEEWTAQLNRIIQMGKIIETLTTMFMKPSQPKAEAEAVNTTKTVTQHSHAQLTRKVLRILRTSRLDPQEVEGDLGFSHAPEAELKDRKILKICRKKEEEETKKSAEERVADDVEAEVTGRGFERAHETELRERKILKIRRKTEEEEKIESAAKSAAAQAAAKEAETKEDMRAKKERRRDWADGRARKWKSYYHNLEKETEEKATRRLGNEIERREEQSKAFVTWRVGVKIPVKLSGLQRAIEYNGKHGVVLKWLEGKGKFQVQLENGFLVAVAPENVIREPTRGAEGREAGLQRKEKSIQERRLRKISRIKRAGASWVKRSPTQEISGMRNKKQKASRQTRTGARVLRTSDPKIRTKIKYNNNGGKTEGVERDRGVMSLKIYSTKREKIKLIQRARTKVRYKKAFPMQEIKGNVSDYETDYETDYKDLGKRPIPSKINTKGKRSVHNDWWWKIPTPSRINTKRKIQKGSTDVYLLKRTIELEID